MPTMLKIALPGFDVAKASPEQCAVHSDYPAPKIDSAKEHFLNVRINFVNEPPGPGSTNSTLTTVIYQPEHGYNYVPQLWVHIEYALKTGVSNIEFTFGPGDAFLGALTVADSTYLRVYADDKNYYIAVERNTGPFDTNTISLAGTSVNVRLYVLADGVLDE